MSIARTLLRGVKEKILTRYGDRIASSLGDTSSDAPSGFREPKRKLYEALEKEGKIDPQVRSDR